MWGIAYGDGGTLFGSPDKVVGSVEMGEPLRLNSVELGHDLYKVFNFGSPPFHHIPIDFPFPSDFVDISRTFDL